jgi:hypothetical protein
MFFSVGSSVSVAMGKKASVWTSQRPPSPRRLTSSPSSSCVIRPAPPEQQQHREADDERRRDERQQRHHAQHAPAPDVGAAEGVGEQEADHGGAQRRGHADDDGVLGRLRDARLGEPAPRLTAGLEQHGHRRHQDEEDEQTADVERERADRDPVGQPAPAAARLPVRPGRPPWARIAREGRRRHGRQTPYRLANSFDTASRISPARTGS